MLNSLQNDQEAEHMDPSARAHGLTVGHIFGEIVLLMAKSTRHSQVTAEDLPARLLPAIKARQFHLFRNKDVVIGAAVWASVSQALEPAIEAALTNPTTIFDPSIWTSGDRIWLMDLIAPFANTSNRHAELMIGDLIAGPFNGKSFMALQIHAVSGGYSAVEVPSDAAKRLRLEIARNIVQGIR